MPLPNHSSSSNRSTDAADAGQAEVLRALRRGDDLAWAHLIGRYGNLVQAISRRHGLTSDQGEDVSQYTWLQLLRTIHRIRDVDRLAGWIATTARRQCLAVSRRTRREVPTADFTSESAVTFDVDDHLDSLLRARLLRRAVATLPPRERALVELLLELEQPSYREISERLGMPMGAIGPVRQRALRRLRTAVSQDADVRAEQAV